MSGQTAPLAPVLLMLQHLAPWLVIMCGIYVIGLAVTGGNLGLMAPRVRARPIMTPTELKTLGYIRAALPHAHILAQVSMGALLRPAYGLNRAAAQGWRNRYNQKIVDFVAINPTSGAVIALIELDDRTHSELRDRRRDRITAAAGYRTIRLSGARYPTAQSVRATIHAALQTPLYCKEI